MAQSRMSSRQWRRSAVAAAAGLCLASVVFAQQTLGSINGRANSGDSVTVENTSIGVSRTVSADSSGAFQIGNLPAGSYTLTITRAGGAKEQRTVEVSSGVGTTLNLSTAQQVVVTGQIQRIDMRSVESSQVLSSAQLDRIPVARDVTSIALLAPTATLGDSRLGSTSARAGNVPSLGGASPAENTYYVNGFNVTNIVNGVAFNQVPEEAVASVEVKTGGYGAEFGRSLGGVMSIVTKRGTNEWKGGANVIWQPSDMAGSSVYAKREGNTWNLIERPGSNDITKINVWGGGPVIKDKLFVFGLVQAYDQTIKTYSNDIQTELKNNSPQYLLKVDWNLNDNHRLELTSFNDKATDKVKQWKQVEEYGTAKGDFDGLSKTTTGGANHILAWNGQLTDDFSMRALVGRGIYDRESSIAGADCPIAQDRRTSPIVQLGCWTGNGLVGDPKALDRRTAYRLDAEYNLSNHTIRAGLDFEKYEVRDATQYSGAAGPYGLGLYQIRVLNPGQTLANGYENTGTTPIEYVRFRHFENGGEFTTKNSAWYLEDTVKVGKDVTLYAGIRNEQFENLNGDGKSFIKISNTWAPRLGATWDVTGNGDLKLAANIGRYYIPVYANTNVRLSGRELDYQDFFEYGGSISSDRYQIPALGAQLGTRVVSSNGDTPDPRTVVDPNLKPMFQDEFQIGLEKALADRWKVGVKYTHRELKSAMDDMCNDEGAGNWAASTGQYTQDQIDTIAETIGHCFLYNPGKNLTANVPLGPNGELQQITIPASALGMPKPKRKYDALEFSFERAWDKKWSFQGSYVLAYSKGNTEGYVKSDIGQDDAGISQDFDYPGLMEGSYGYLPNDRRHTFKAFGAYALTDEWRVGMNLLAQSGRPKNCFGVYDGTLDGVSAAYGDASFWCGGTLNKRGSLGRLDWTHQVDLQLHYEPAWLKGASLTVDVLNIFDKRTVRGILEAEDQGMFDPDSDYGRPILNSLQRARTVRITAQYEF